MMAFLAERSIPPMLAAPAYKRIESGEMGFQAMTTLAETVQPAAIVSWEGRLDRVPGLRAWIDQHYALAHAPEADRRIHVPAQTQDASLATSREGLAITDVIVPAPRVEPCGELSVDAVLCANHPLYQDCALTVNLMELDGSFRRAQTDVRPLDDTFPTSDWAPGQMVVQRIRLMPAPETPPGPKMLRMALYSHGSRRLPLRNANGDPIAGSELRADVEPIVRWEATREPPNV